MAGPSLSPAGAPARLDYVDELWEAGERAAEAAGGFQERCFSLAGTTIRLRFAGPAMVEALAATFAHHPAADPEEAELTAVLWDSESTRSPAPPPPWELTYQHQHGRIQGLFSDGIYATYESHWGSLAVLDVERGRFLNWRRSGSEIPWYEQGTPLHAMLHLWLSSRGIQLVHAGAVGASEGAALLAGKSGAGKTTTSLTPLVTDSTLRMAGDDYCLLRTDLDPPRVYSIYGRAKTTDETMRRLNGLDELVIDPIEAGEQEKTLLDLATRRPGYLLPEAPLRAICVMRVSGELETRIERAPQAAALAAIAPSTLLQLPGADEATMGRIASLANSTPCYHLHAGTDPEALIAALEQLLDGSAERTAAR